MQIRFRETTATSRGIIEGQKIVIKSYFESSYEGTNKSLVCRARADVNCKPHAAIGKELLAEVGISTTLDGNYKFLLTFPSVGGKKMCSY